MITNTGKNLSVVISTEADQNWQAFATWYSFFKNLPDASVRIICARNNTTPFQYFQWAKRLKIPVLHYTPVDRENPKASRLEVLRQMPIENYLVARSLVMAIDVLEDATVELLNLGSVIDEDVQFFKKQTSIRDGTKTEENWLCADVKTSENPRSFVSCHKGCGRWIHTLKGCPFSNVNGLMTTEMNASENRVFDLWRQMCYLYSVVN